MPKLLEQPVVRSFNELARAFAGDYSFLNQRPDQPTEAQKRAWQPFYDGAVSRAWTDYQGGASGGYALSYELAKTVWDKARSVEGPLSQCLIYTTKLHGFKVPSFGEVSRLNGSRWGGIQAYWQGQHDVDTLSNAGSANQIGATKPTLAMIDFEMKRCIVYTEPMSRDLIADTGIVESMLTYAAHHEIRYALTDKMLNGYGLGSPLGVCNAPGSVFQARNTGGQIKSIDIDNMWSHMWPFCRRNAIWITNDDGILAIDSAATTYNWPQSIYLPEGAASNRWPLMKGRPVIVCEQAQLVGTKGDLILADFSQYGIAVRQLDGGVPSMEVGYGRPEVVVEGTYSEHLKFDSDSVVFKWKLRADGKPMWHSVVQVANNAQPASAFVVLT